MQRPADIATSSPPAVLDDRGLAELNALYEHAHPCETLAWAFENVPRLVIASSFQVGGLVNVYFARELVGRVPVLFLQTGFHFPETLAFRDRVVSAWGLDLIETEPTLGPDRQERELGPELYRTDPDRCCELNKVLPLQRTLDRFDGWVTGLRRDQGPSRAGTRIFEREILRSGRAIWKINPLARWSKDRVWALARAYDIPVHPLYEQGYASIGCAPCTRPVLPGEDERAGRWSDSGKTECGIHGGRGA